MEKPLDETRMHQSAQNAPILHAPMRMGRFQLPCRERARSSQSLTRQGLSDQRRVPDQGGEGGFPAWDCAWLPVAGNTALAASVAVTHGEFGGKGGLPAQHCFYSFLCEKHYC